MPATPRATQAQSPAPRCKRKKTTEKRIAMNKAMPTHAASASDADLPPSADHAPSAIAARRPRRTATKPPANASIHPAPVDGIALPSTLLDITPQQAGTQTLLRGLAILEAAAAGVRDLRTFGAALGTTRSTTHRLVSSARAGALPAAGARRLPARPEADRTRHDRTRTDAAHRGRPPASRIARGTDARHDPPRRARRRRRAVHRQNPRHPRPRNALARRSPHAAGVDGNRQGHDARPHAGRLAVALRRIAPRARRRQLQAGQPPRRADLHAAHDATTPHGGYTFDLEENEASIRCVAAPVRDASGAVVAALSVASTIPYMSLERMDELIPVVQREARAISEELGWRVPQPATRRIKR